MTIVSDALARYGSVGSGLVIGTAARYGLALSEGRRFTWRTVLADALQLGLVGLAAVIISDRLGLTGDMKAFMAALAGVSSDRLIKLLRAWFLKRAAGELGVEQLAQVAREADLAEVPAGDGAPHALRAQVLKPVHPISTTLHHGYDRMTGKRPPEDLIEALRQLDHD